MGFTENLCELMKVKGVSSYKMATSVGVHISTVTNWREGSSPKKDHILPIAKALGVSVDDLFAEKRMD